MAVPPVISSAMIKNKLLLVAISVASIVLPDAVRAQSFEIQIGDRPFYNHGARYWAGDYEMIWVPGHMSNGHHWVHGHYIRGEHRRHNWDRHHDDRYNEGNDYHDDQRR
jgi:hypothetical protein